MHSFGFYLKKGFTLTGLLFRKLRFMDKLLLALYFIASFFGKLIPFVRPVFLIGDQNIALMLNEGHDVEVTKIFEGVNDKKRYTSLVLSSLYIYAVVIGFGLVTVVPFVALALLGQLLFHILAMYITFTLLYIIAIVLLVCLVIAMYFIYYPVGFVAARGVDLTAGDVMYYAKRASKGNIWKIFVLGLICYLPIYVSLIVILAAIYGSIYLSAVVNPFFIALTVVLALLIPILELFAFIGLKVAYETALYAIFNDSIEVKHLVLARQSPESFDEYVAIFADDRERK